MITLREKILESLLDDEEDLLDDNKIEIDEFVKYYGVSNSEQVVINKNIASVGDGYMYILDWVKPIGELFSKVDTIKSNNRIPIRFDSKNEISDRTICDQIIAPNIECSFLDKAFIKNIDLDVLDSKYGVLFIESRRLGAISLENVNIHTSKELRFGMRTAEIPVFKNVNIDKETQLNIYCRYIAPKDKDSFLYKLENLLDTTYKMELSNFKTGKITKRTADISGITKTLKGRILMVNTDSSLFKIKQNTKVTDFITLPKNIYKVYFECPDFSMHLIKPGYYDENELKKGVGAYYDKFSDGWLLKFDRK